MQTENTYIETDLGNIALNPRGEYSDEVSYEYLDTVSYKGGSYICVAELGKSISGIAPAQGKNTEHWQMLTLPGQLTPEAAAMHDDVVNKAKQVETSRAAVELSQQEVEAAQADVSQMRQDTQDASQMAIASRDSAAGYAQSAEISRTAAKESEDNVKAQESKVVQSVIDEGTKQIKAVSDKATEQIGTINTTGSKQVSIIETKGADQVEAIQKAGENAFQNIGNGVDKGLSEEGKAADAKATGEAISKLTEDMTSKADKMSLAQTNRKLDALWKLNQGISYEFQTEDTEAYQKTVPSGAKMASVKSIGGKTIVWNWLSRVAVETGSVNGIGYVSDGKNISLNGSATSYTEIIVSGRGLTVPVLKGHKYYISIGLTESISGLSIVVGGTDMSVNTQTKGIKTCTTGETQLRFLLSVQKGVTFNNIVTTPKLVDLTKMFGAGNEPSTPEEFEAMFPADYYEYNVGELMSVPVNEVIYSDTKNQETSYLIPQAILNLPGYGWSTGNVRNEVDFENKKYIQRVGKYVITGDERFETKYLPIIVFNNENYAIKPNTKAVNDKGLNIISANEKGNAWQFRITDIGLDNNATTDDIKEWFKEHPVTVYYPMLNEESIDISDVISNTFQEPLEVEAGGTLTFKNSNGDDYRIPVPSSEEYVISLAEVTK